MWAMRNSCCQSVEQYTQIRGRPARRDRCESPWGHKRLYLKWPLWYSVLWQSLHKWGKRLSGQEQVSHFSLCSRIANLIESLHCYRNSWLNIGQPDFRSACSLEKKWKHLVLNIRSSMNQRSDIGPVFEMKSSATRCVAGMPNICTLTCTRSLRPDRILRAVNKSIEACQVSYIYKSLPCKGSIVLLKTFAKVWRKNVENDTAHTKGRKLRSIPFLPCRLRLMTLNQWAHWVVAFNKEASLDKIVESGRQNEERFEEPGDWRVDGVVVVLMRKSKAKWNASLSLLHSIAMVSVKLGQRIFGKISPLESHVCSARPLCWHRWL